MGPFSLNAIARRASKIGQGAIRELRLSILESLAVSQLEPDGALAAARGSRYAGGCQVIASGIAPVSAIPTTTATLALYNTASDGGLSLSLDGVSFCLGSGTAAAGATLWACVSNGKPASVPSAASNYSSQALGAIGNSSFGRWATAVTIPSGSAWFQIATSQQLAAANVGQGDTPGSINGFVVPPGYCAGFAILSGAGTSPLYSVSATWYELELDLEPA